MLCPIIFEKKTKQRTLFKICETQKPKLIKSIQLYWMLWQNLYWKWASMFRAALLLGGRNTNFEFLPPHGATAVLPARVSSLARPYSPPACSLLSFFFLHFLICMMLSESLFVSSARFRIGNLVLPGRPLLFIGRGNNNISAYFVGFELPSPPFPLPPPPPTIPSADVSTQLNDTGDPRSRFHLPRGRTEKHCRLYLTHVCVQ